MTRIETLTWHPAALPPDADTDVLVAFGDTGGTLVGAWMGEDEGWVGTDGAPLEDVAFWASMPMGPQLRAHDEGDYDLGLDGRPNSHRA